MEKRKILSKLCFHGACWNCQLDPCSGFPSTFRNIAVSLGVEMDGPDKIWHEILMTSLEPRFLSELIPKLFAVGAREGVR